MRKEKLVKWSNSIGEEHDLLAYIERSHKRTVLIATTSRLFDYIYFIETKFSFARNPTFTVLKLKTCGFNPNDVVR